MTEKRVLGVVTYDVSSMLLDGTPFMANGRLYVSPRRVPSLVVTSTNERRDLYVMPVWSKKYPCELMTLELILVREVVPLGVNGGITGGDAFIRPLVVVGRSSEKAPKEINVLEMPEDYKNLFDTLFPTGSPLSEASEMAYAILNKHVPLSPLFAGKRNGQNPSDCKEEGDSLGEPAEDGVRVENGPSIMVLRSLKTKRGGEIELPEEKDEKAAVSSERGDEDDSQDRRRRRKRIGVRQSNPLGNEKVISQREKMTNER